VRVHAAAELLLPPPLLLPREAAALAARGGRGRVLVRLWGLAQERLVLAARALADAQRDVLACFLFDLVGY